MAIVQTTGRRQLLTPTNNGDLFKLGNTSNEDDVGGWILTLVPTDGNFAGSFVVLGRNAMKTASDNNAPFIPIPYRTVCTNNVAADYSFSAAPITGTSMVIVPAYGIAIAVLVACTAGSANLYSNPINGPMAP